MAQMLYDETYVCFRVEENLNGEYYVFFRSSTDVAGGTEFYVCTTTPDKFAVSKEYRLMVATKEEDNG